MTILTPANIGLLVGIVSVFILLVFFIRITYNIEKKIYSYRHGVTRIVIPYGEYVLKIPNFTFCHLHFLQGCYANYSERSYCKNFKDAEDQTNYELVVPSLFCSWFGLLQVQYRGDLLDRELTPAEKKKFKNVCSGDLKRDNFAIYNGEIRCVDYP